MIPDKIERAKSGKIRVKCGDFTYVFWTDAEFKEFSTRNLKYKPDDVELQNTVKEILKADPDLTKIEVEIGEHV